MWTEMSGPAILAKIGSRIKEIRIRQSNFHTIHPVQIEVVQSTSNSSVVFELISGGTGLFDLPADNGSDYEEDIFRRRMQQPQKKRRGRRM